MGTDVLDGRISYLDKLDTSMLLELNGRAGVFTPAGV
jgi:hypothetical protein